MVRSFGRLAFATFLASVALGTSAKADLTPILTSAVANGNNTLFTYNVSLSTGSLIAGGGVNDYITMYDIAGYVNNSVTIVDGFGATWIKSQQNTGLTPAQLSPTDNPNVVNLTFEYTTAQSVTGIGQTVLTFSFLSIFTQAGGQFNQYAGSSTNAQNSTVQGNVGYVAGPNPAVPEPSTYVLLGLGSVLCTAYARRFCHNQVA